MSREYKNILEPLGKSFGIERRANLTKEILKDSSPLPNPLEYKDIDEEFRRWVDEDLSISFEGEKIPTISLFSNQRFSEYMQSWQNVDDKKNIILNFKSITRENNPKSGSLNGNTRNIPGERTYLMKRVEARDKNDRKYFIDYRVKQPFAVDLIYTVGLFTNKYELINTFNQMINDKFKAINCYIRPKGHFIPMELTDISDESDYSIDDRQFYSQYYSIKVMGYIMPPDSFIVEEKPLLVFKGFENDQEKSYAEIEEMPNCYQEHEYENIKIKITVHIGICSSKYKFNIDSNFNGKFIPDKDNNARSFKLYINGTEKNIDENIELKENDEVYIKSVYKYNNGKECIITFEGYDPSNKYDKSEGEEQIEYDYSNSSKIDE